MIIIFGVRHSAMPFIVQLTLPTYAFLCLCFDSMLIRCNIFVKLEHFILVRYFDMYHTFIYYNHDKHKIML